MVKISVLLILWCLPFSLLSQGEFEYCNRIEQAQQTIKKYHFSPPNINEKERDEVAFMYVNDLDEGNFFITLEECNAIREEAKAKGFCAAFEFSIAVYEKALLRYDSLSKRFFANPIVFKKDKFLIHNRNNSSHLRHSQKQFASSVEDELTFDYLNDLMAAFEADSSLGKKLNSELEKKLRLKLAKENEKMIAKRLADKEGLREMLFDYFLNALAKRYDPHSSYFSMAGKKDFEKELSGDNYMFGIQYKETENLQIEITVVVPASAAWNSNKLEEGDLVLAIKSKKGPWLELGAEGIEQLSEVLRNTMEATFRIKHKNGSVEEVHLIKTKVENTENSFHGYVLGEGTKKVGYIALPAFYTDYDSDAQLGCANDIAKEILLLKKDSIKGLILDLRNNGGGSLKEAIELCGLFIDEGPMAIYQGKEEKPYLLKDMNRGTVYNGPLMILVNSMSASASEFFAGCMQDYKRALIVGDSTYGKGTAQSIFPVGDDFMARDFVKVTHAKFYTVSSRSNQELGIVPDILMEDLYSEMSFVSEKMQNYVLHNDSTSKKALFKVFASPFNSFLAQKAISKEQKRNAKAVELASKIKNDYKIPLDIEAFKGYYANETTFWENIYKNDVEFPFNVELNSFAQKLAKVNTLEQDAERARMKELKQDEILFNTFRLFEDFITFEKK